MKFIIFLIYISLLGCTVTPTISPDSGYIVPKSCGDRWICEADCDPDYPYLCEPWSTNESNNN